MKQESLLVFLIVLQPIASIPTLKVSNNASTLKLFNEIALNDYQIDLIDYALRIFCGIQTIFLNISIEYFVSQAAANYIINTLAACSACGITISR